MECMYKTIMPMMIFVVSSLNAMQDDADEWLNAAQRAYEKTEGVQQVKEEKDTQHEAQASFEKFEQTESPAVQEYYDEATFDENDPSTWFSECPEQGQPLTCDYFKRKRYFQRAVSLPQEQKNNQLGDNTDNRNFEEYPKTRCKISGWVCTGADPNSKSKEYRARALVAPVGANDFRLLELLIVQKANPNKATPGMSPLCWAENKEMVELLVGYGANVNCRCDGRKTLLHRAIKSPIGGPSWGSCSPDLVEYYIQQNISINSVDDNNDTALHVLSTQASNPASIFFTSSDNLIRTAQALLKAGINLDTKNREGKTAQDYLRECKKYNDNCKLLYDRIEEERNNRLKQLQKNGGDHGMYV